MNDTASLPMRAAIATLRKDLRALPVPPNMPDLDAARADFSWDDARAALEGLPAGALNIAHEAVARHARGPRAAHTALRWLGAEGEVRDLSYRDLDAAASRFAHVLRDAGLVRGDRLFVLAPRVPALHVAVLGALKAGLVVCPLYPAFGPEPIATRMTLGEARALLTTASLYRRKVQPLRERLPGLSQVFIADATSAEDTPPGTSALPPLMATAADRFDCVPTAPDEPALLHFTSGTTGRPKGAIHVHEAVLTHWATGLHALDLHPDDVFWCTADPGWVTGMSYGVIAPLVHGVTLLVDEAEFDPVRWYTILQEQRVTVWYTAPTAIRMLMRAGAELAAGFRRPALRFVASVGEPLGAGAVLWGEQVLGQPIHDNWWQTETGGIMIANTIAQDIKPGSMGRPLPGVEAAIVARREDGTVQVIGTPDTPGELALRPGWPSMFRGYLGEPARYAKCFASDAGGDWYLSGDLARRDADGCYWFVGRADDLIKSAGHLIGPFEVESCLMAHPAVVEAAVVGLPDALLGESVRAYVTLHPGFEPDEATRRALLAHARTQLGAAVAPKSIEFASVLPHTRSGKIMRRLLKARALGLPEGDTSTLESGPDTA